jgi:adenylylsulfate kinase-like enzyme
LSQQGLVVLVAGTAHRDEHRERAREAAPCFIEVWVNTPIEECERRDPKKLYARARLGELTSLPGVQIKYETPAKPGIIACGGLSTEAVGEILERITGVAP